VANVEVFDPSHGLVARPKRYRAWSWRGDHWVCLCTSDDPTVCQKAGPAVVLKHPLVPVGPPTRQGQPQRTARHEGRNE
jgi:hypothetical protein